MRGKILGEKFYTVMIPYRGYWPGVHEIRYEPHPDEEGLPVRFWLLRDAHWLGIMPDRSRYPRTDVVMTEQKVHAIPLQAILEMERHWFNTLGPAAYDRCSPFQTCRITHLVIEKNGEQLADYMATFGYSDRVVYTEFITFGTDGAKPDIPHAGMMDGGLHPSTFPRPLEVMNEERQLSDIELLAGLQESLRRVVKRLAPPHRIEVTQDAEDPTKFNFHWSGRR